MKAKPRNSPIPATSAPAPHDRDFYTWTTETAQAIREGSFNVVDWESVAEELEDMGRSEQRELESRLGVLLAHLLKWRHRSEPAAIKSWALTIEEQRRRTRQLLKQSPGLKRMLEETFAEAYGDARLQAARDCGVDKNAFPDTCPWAFDQTMDDGFWPGHCWIDRDDARSRDQDQKGMSTRSDNVLLEHYRRLGNQGNDFRNRNLRSLVASMVTGTSVLDIGCGSGHLLRLLQDQGKDVVGLEPSGELVDLAQALHGPLRIEHGSPEDIDGWPHRFDTITIIDVLEHIQDDVQQLRRMKALLKPRGRLVIVAPAFQALYGPRDAEQGHFRRYERGDLVGKLQMTGYRVGRVRYWNAMGFLPYFIASRVLPRLLRVDLRSAHKKGTLKRVMIKVLDGWYRYFENRVNCGFGLSLIAVAEKPSCDTTEGPRPET